MVAIVETNYCRNLQRQCRELLAIPNLQPARRAELEHVIDLCRASVKFLLPHGGVLLEDSELRGLEEGQELRLPFPFVALEYTADLSHDDGALVPARRVLFCREHDDGIAVMAAAFTNENGCWAVKDDFVIPKKGYVLRSEKGGVLILANYPLGFGPSNGNYSASTVLGFLNALTCSNVGIQRMAPRKANKKGKAALPFDTYHVLTVDSRHVAGERAGTQGEHRSPREHIRRGHIRRLSSGAKIWINATVVAAGRSAGKVQKDYRLQRACHSTCA